MIEIKDKTSLVFAIALIVIILGLIIGSLFGTGPVSQNTTSSSSQIITEPSISNNTQPNNADTYQINTVNRPIRGSQNPKVLLVVFDDYECDFCLQYHETLLRVLLENPVEVGIVTKHFPVTQRHPNSRKAAEAFECAVDQGPQYGFLLGDLMFANQNDLSTTSIKGYANQTGLNLTKFSTCLDTNSKASFVEADFQEGLRLGITGTPTTFINGQKIVGTLPYTQLNTLVKSITASPVQN